MRIFKISLILQLASLSIQYQGKKLKLSTSRDIGKLIRPEVTWKEIIRQHKFDFRVRQIFTEILWKSVLEIGMLALSFRSLPLVHIFRFTTRLVKGPLTHVGDFTFGTFPLSEETKVIQV
ncbi:hypothetical protein Fot_06586 [Forsythia ovata]|uniref:Uncharacterized protein n=1 Tax=Forsythia ovata TaxID=205694 RepID=A0ABD1WTE9_9LAMI